MALEAGNSASIIFKHYRELTTPEVAEKWFGILPKDGQRENTLTYDRKKRRVIRRYWKHPHAFPAAV